MDGLEPTVETPTRRVTPQEASRMVELWTASTDPSAPATIPLGDVAEALGLPESEAAALLARARQEPTIDGAKPENPVLVILAILLFLSLFFTTVWSLSLAGRLITGTPYKEGDGLVFALCAAWSLGWLFLFRRPIARGLAEAARRLREARR